MNRFVSPKKARRRGALAAVSSGAAVLLLALLFAAVQDVQRAYDAEQLASLRESVMRAAVHCYAVEGVYPQSLDELRTRYGLVYDERRFLVDYRAFASNLMPDITVVPR